MSFKHWLRHLRQWLYEVRQFPLPWKDDCVWIGRTDGDVFESLVCERKETRQRIERERRRTMIEAIAVGLCVSAMGLVLAAVGVVIISSWSGRAEREDYSG